MKKCIQFLYSMDSDVRTYDADRFKLMYNIANKLENTYRSYASEQKQTREVLFFIKLL